MIVADYIRLQAEKYPDKIAVVVDDVEVTYIELFNRVNQIAWFLESNYKIDRQDRVILFACRNVDFIACYFALHKLNLIVLPMDVNISSSTLDYIFGEVKPSLVIGNFKPDNYVGNFQSFQGLFSACNFDEKYNVFSNVISLDTVADLMFTSGTTGSPKAIMLSHSNLLVSTRHITNFVGNTFNDIEVLALPICHSFGLGRLRSVFYAGGTVVLYNGFFNVKGLFHAIQCYKATGFSMVPAGWKILKKLSGTKIAIFSSQLRYIEFGSACLSSDEKKDLLKLLPNTKLYMHYGLTEASRSLFMEFHVDPLDSIGYPVDNVTVKIINEDGNELEDECIGEICIKGEHVTQGFWSNNSFSKTEFYGEYFRTGDIGYKRGKYFYLAGRIKDIINVGGKKVSAAEVEEVSMQFPGVEECACVGVTDDVLGEQIKLFIVKSINDFDVSSLRYFLITRLERYKVPCYYEFVDTLPKTYNGKIKKYLLK